MLQSTAGSSEGRLHGPFLALDEQAVLVHHWGLPAARASRGLPGVVGVWVVLVLTEVLIQLELGITGQVASWWGLSDSPCQSTKRRAHKLPRAPSRLLKCVAGEMGDTWPKQRLGSIVTINCLRLPAALCARSSSTEPNFAISGNPLSASRLTTRAKSIAHP